MDECHDCGEPAVLDRGPRRVPLGDHTVTVHAEYMRCTSCGEIYFSPGQMQAMQCAAVDILRQEEGLLSPGEIEAIRRGTVSRKWISSSSSAPIPPKLVRWERGSQAPSGLADTLLPILRDHPDVVEQLARERGIPVRLDPDQQAGAGTE
jgi:DNA-binding transcriptional regulator YiaG